MRILAFVMLFAVTMVAAADTKLLEHVPLKWKPTSVLKSFTLDDNDATVQIETFQDVRDNKEEIGENRERSTPRPVTTTDDVGAFVSTHMRELLGHAGVKTVDSDGSVKIKGEVRQFFVSETHTYDSRVIVHLTVEGRDGSTLWSGLATGEESRFGRSYKLDNYYEVLSDAIINAVTSMLQSSEFQKALSGQRV
jgi:hypothetical protein